MQRPAELLRHHKRLVIAGALFAIVLVNLIVFAVGFSGGEISHCPRHLPVC
jgi:hypothetical protein